MFPDSAVKFVAQGPAEYASSEEATRFFCSRCGTQLAFRASYIPGFIDITVGSLDTPMGGSPFVLRGPVEHEGLLQHSGLAFSLGFQAHDERLPHAEHDVRIQVWVSAAEQVRG